MKWTSNTKLLLVVILVLIISNLTLLFVFLNNNKDHCRTKCYHKEKKHHHDGDDKHDYNPWEDLNLTEEQTEAFKNAHREYKNLSKPIIKELGNVRNKLFETLNSNETVDTNFIIAYADTSGMLHSELKKITGLHYLKLKEICEPEQYEELRRHFKKMEKYKWKRKSHDYHRSKGCCKDDNK